MPLTLISFCKLFHNVYLQALNSWAGISCTPFTHPSPPLSYTLAWYAYRINSGTKCMEEWKLNFKAKDLFYFFFTFWEHFISVLTMPITQEKPVFVFSINTTLINTEAYTFSRRMCKVFFSMDFDVGMLHQGFPAISIWLYIFRNRGCRNKSIAKISHNLPYESWLPATELSCWLNTMREKQ